MKNIFCRGVLLLLVATSTMVLGQMKPLKIGDAIPATMWTTPLQVVNAPQKTTTLSADKGKLILLDFWNTWCSACLLYFPKMEKLKEQFGDQVKILAVGDQDRTTLEKFFATTNGQRYKSTVSIAGDKMFNTIFPHRGVPYVVWIKDGKLLNTTDAAQVNEKTIAEVLGNEKSSLQTVVQMNLGKPLMLSEAYEREKGFALAGYSLFGRGRIRGMPFGSWFHRKDGVVYGRRFTNFSYIEICRAIVKEIFQSHNEAFGKNRIIIEATDPTVLSGIYNADGSLQEDNLYSYEFIVPVADAQMLYPSMLDHLNNVANYATTIEKRKTKCWVLKRTSNIDKLASKGGEVQYETLVSGIKMTNAPFFSFVNMLNNLPFLTIPVTNITEYTGNIDIQLDKTTDVTSLRNELAKYDLQLVEEEREIDMAIIRDKK